MLKITNDMDEVLHTENAVAYFTATWCQPCKALKPQFAKAGMTDDNHSYFVVDVDEIDSSYLDLYNIKSVPTVFKMDNGVVRARITARTTEEIIAQINQDVIG
jgi:thiol-disulfide isomerase/thioredoxin